MKPVLQGTGQWDGVGWMGEEWMGRRSWLALLRHCGAGGADGCCCCCCVHPSTRYRSHWHARSPALLHARVTSLAAGRSADWEAVVVAVDRTLRCPAASVLAAIRVGDLSCRSSSSTSELELPARRGLHHATPVCCWRTPDTCSHRRCSSSTQWGRERDHVTRWRRRRPRDCDVTSGWSVVEMVKTFQAYLPSECHRTYSCVHCRAHLANHDELISKVRLPLLIHLHAVFHGVLLSFCMDGVARIHQEITGSSKMRKKTQQT